MKKTILLPQDIQVSRSRARRRGGYTLIELLVVLIILGIASCVVFMAVGKGLLGARGKGIIKEFGRLLTEARARSVGQGRPVYLLIYGDDRAFGIKGEDRVDVPEDVEIRGEGVEDYDEGVYAITFFPDGSSSGGTVIFSMPDGETYYFRINKFFGAIEVETEDGSDGRG